MVHAVTRLLKEPLLHFVVLGMALFGLYGLFGTKQSEERQKIVVSAAQIANLQQLFARTWQRHPTPEELTGLVEDSIRDEVYYREGKALELDRDDIVIRRRIRQKMEFFAEDTAAAKPTDSELNAYLASHPDQFRNEDTVTFHHVFLSSAREEALEQRAEEIGAKLASKEDREIGLGDAFLLGDSFRAIFKSDAVRTFGKDFAERIFGVPMGRWQGPIPSGYGLHFIFIDGRAQGTLPPLDVVRPAVEREWANTRRTENLEEFYRALRRRYDIAIETPRARSEAQAHQTARAVQ